MKQSKKWFAMALVCTQFITALPVSATVIATDESLDFLKPEDQPPMTPECQIPQPEEVPPKTDEMCIEEELPPVIEVPKESPKEQPASKPDPEEPNQAGPLKEENKPSTLPQPDQSADKEIGTENNQLNSAHRENRKMTEALEMPPTVKVSPDSFVLSTEKETWDFIKEIGEDARVLGLEEDLYASVMIAQAILESASGQSQLSQSPYYNLFGIKETFERNGVIFKTQEDDGIGNLYTTNAAFRQYDGYEDSLEDYAHLLKNGLTNNRNFYKGTWKSQTETYEDATDYLTGRYATDVTYGEKLNALIEAYALTSYDKEKAELPKGNNEMISPVKNPVVSSAFGSRGDGFHRGVDFASPSGTPIFASLEGTVIRSEYHSSWGNYIAIEHKNGLTTLYAHNNQNLVTIGQNVAQGEIITSMGSTGRSSGPHLHFEVSLSPNLEQEQLIDPLSILLNR